MGYIGLPKEPLLWCSSCEILGIFRATDEKSCNTFTVAENHSTLNVQCPSISSSNFQTLRVGSSGRFASGLSYVSREFHGISINFRMVKPQVGKVPSLTTPLHKNDVWQGKC